MTSVDDIDAQARARRIKLLVMDVDGVLTDGALLYGGSGNEYRLQAFHVHDGLGIALARSAGLKVGWLSGRHSEAVSRRAQELGVDVLAQRVKDKGAALAQMARKQGLALEQAAFMGDDLNDLPALCIAGLALAPADAVPVVREAAHYVSKARAGRGAVREAVELVLRAQGRLEQAQAAFVAQLEVAGDQSAGRTDYSPQ